MVRVSLLLRATLLTAMLAQGASDAEAKPAAHETDTKPPTLPTQEKSTGERTPQDRKDGESETPITAREVALAPKAHEVRGLAVKDPSRKPSGVRTVGRLLLTVPRWGFSLAMQPVRAGVWAYDRYQLGERFKRIFFNETETIGLFPSFFFETGFGLNTGLRFVHRNVFGRNESIRARGGWGGQYLQRYSLSVDSGDRIRRLRLEMSGEIELRDREHFAGIGNRDIGDFADLMFPLDPLAEGPAIDARYRQRFGRVWAAAHVPVAGPLSFKASAGVIDRKFSDKNVDLRGEVVISDAYDLASIPGFSENPRFGYAELELSFTTQRVSSEYIPTVWWSTGWALRAFGGPARGLGGDDARFFRYGVDLQRYINLFDSSRVLVVRAYGEGVSDPPGEHVPFSELPSLGGKRMLRGYPDSRFRDRYVGQLSAEYQFDINAGSYGYLFVDSGKAMRTIDSDAFSDLRHGFGGGVQINSQHSFLARILAAGSKDGDFLLSLSFEPQFNLRERFDRR